MKNIKFIIRKTKKMRNFGALIILVLTMFQIGLVFAATPFEAGADYSTPFNSRNLDPGVTGSGSANVNGIFQIGSNAISEIQAITDCKGSQNEYLLDTTTLTYTYNLGSFSTPQDLSPLGSYYSVVEWESFADDEDPFDYVSVEMDLRLYKGSYINYQINDSWTTGLNDPWGHHETSYQIFLQASPGSTWLLMPGSSYYLKIIIKYITFGEYIAASNKCTGGWILDNYNAGEANVWGQYSSSTGCIYFRGRWIC